MDDAPPPIAADLDHFALFDLERRFVVVRKDLDRAFLALSRRYHPDLFAASGGSALAAVQRASARINDAHRTLKDPVARAEYLLSLAGITRPAGEAKCPPDLLATVFELRERILEGPREGLPEEAHALLAGAEAALEDLYAAHDSAEDTDVRRATLVDVRQALDRRKFLANLVREVERTPGA